MGKLPIPLTLGVIVVTIGVSVVWSLLSTRGGAGGSHPGEPTTPAPAVPRD
ncbi:hypothetical protein [Jidongwangia harbinensis]|uniref:hypothetical protein n=1 Tax=Jidongwangia harbinensis TaxID=2878561 RepID=UPI0021056257|nr:hypothetical protein [Jidongwangia harbinensis]